MADYSKVTYVIIDKLYPLVAPAIEKNLNKFKNCISDFINANHKQLYDVGPYDIIYFKRSDAEKMFKALGISENEVLEIMEDCFFWRIPYNPPCAKEPYILVLMCIIRYFLIHKKQKEAEITTCYLAFSGKVYASLFVGAAFPKAPPSKYRAVMDYVINNKLTNKHSLKSEGTLFGAVKAQMNTWLDTYGPDLVGRADDDDIGKMIQQVRDRVKSFLMNIAKLYYEAYENKLYLNYETDNLSDGKEFRITDNDSLRASRYTENAINYMVTNAVSLQMCNKCKDENVKASEVKDIMTAIITDKTNIEQLTRVTNILICDFMRNYPGKSINSIDFMAHSLVQKPNSKDKYIIELNQTLVSWLDENSPNYRRRKNRIATANSYKRACLTYLTLAIVAANKNG